MRWRKLGRVFCPDGSQPWARTHAANCAALPVDEHRYRVYFSSRDDANRAHVGWVLIDLREPRILDVAQRPSLGPGEIGTFDDSGVSLACVLVHDSLYYLYYTGWNLGVTVPWRNSIGLAVSDNGLEFRRRFPSPVLDRNPVDPFSLSYPFVRIEGSRWRMWYGSNLRWGAEQRDMDHVLKYAESSDGLAWQPTGDVCIGIENDGEYAFSKPCVVVDNGSYRMWYSFRGAAYRIGYAESADGVHWTRRDHEAGIAPSAEGWDSESVEYPYVFDHGRERYMLYNGNAYGRTGFGLAILERD